MAPAFQLECVRALALARVRAYGLQGARVYAGSDLKRNIARVPRVFRLGFDQRVIALITYRHFFVLLFDNFFFFYTFYPKIRFLIQNLYFFSYPKVTLVYRLAVVMQERPIHKIKIFTFLLPVGSPSFYIIQGRFKPHGRLN